jgi:hypothetical protein
MSGVASSVLEILTSAESSARRVPPTLLYNEGWLLRLVLQIAAAGIHCLPFAFAPNARWFSEGLLYSAFLPRMRGDKLAESWTHADGVVGHFHLDERTKTGVVLDDRGDQFVICEAKIFSGLSKGTTRAPGYDQAARNVACMAWTLKMAGRPLEKYRSLGFYILAPKRQIDAGIFGAHATAASMREKIAARIASYDDEWRAAHLDAWHREWVWPLLDRIDVQLVAWESVIDRILAADLKKGEELQQFYAKCLQYCAAANVESANESKFTSPKA